MNTYIYLSRDGVRYAVYHRNMSNRTWEHPYSDRSMCRACLGQSEAAPLDAGDALKLSARAASPDRDGASPASLEPIERR